MNKIVKKNNKIFWVLILIFLVTFVFGCQKSQSSDTIKIGILQSAEHDALTSAQTGFLDELAKLGYEVGDEIDVTVFNAQGNQSNLYMMAEQLAKKSDITLAISTSAAQAMATVETEKPILITAVTNPVGAGLANSLESPGRNVTGTRDTAPVADQIALLMSIVPSAQKVGVLYSSSEPNSQYQVDIALVELAKYGVEPVVQTVSSTNDVHQVATSVLNDVDALYIPTDNTLSSTAATVGELAKEYRVPVIPGAIEHAKVGGLATFGTNYESLGRQTAYIAADIIENGTDPATIPIQKPAKVDLYVNEEMADVLGIDPASITIN